MSTHKYISIADIMLCMSDIKDMVVGNLRGLRNSYGMNKAEFARYCGIQQPVYQRMESGDLMPHIESLNKVANKCGMQVWQLLVPNFDPANPPVLRQPSDVEREFYKRIKEAMRDLHIDQ
jgi:transcriptional regulator with XRE-family HTH domain